MSKLEIDIRKVGWSDYLEIKVESDDVKIGLGLFDNDERIEFLKGLQEVIIRELDGYSHNDHAEWWLDSIEEEVERAGYKLVIEDEDDQEV